MFTNVGRWVKAANESFSFTFVHKWLNVVNEERFGQKKNERKRFPQRIIQICNEFETKKNNKLIQCGKPCSWPVEYNVFIQTTKAALGYLN